MIKTVSPYRQNLYYVGESHNLLCWGNVNIIYYVGEREVIQEHGHVPSAADIQFRYYVNIS